MSSGAANTSKSSDTPSSGYYQSTTASTESLVLIQDDDNLSTSVIAIKKDTALAAILNGLKLRDESNRKTMWNRYSKTVTPYDIIIRINSLTDLRTQGWEILLGLHIQRMQPIDSILPRKDTRAGENIGSKAMQHELSDGVVVTILGAYNRGKSYLLNQLCRITVPTGNLVHTEGISITAGRDNYKNIVFLDTAGTDTPIRNSEIDSKRATEALLREVVLHLCTFIIIVVNRLRATDQIYIREILKYCQMAPNKAGVFIVHNLHDVETIGDLNRIIHDEVETIFEAQPREVQPVFNGVNQTNKFFLSKQNNIEVRHFILAKEGSPAAKIWNMQSLDGIMNIFQNAIEHYRKLDVIDSMIKFINTKLPYLFVHTNSSQRGYKQQDLEIVQHSTQPYIVLSDRKTRENLVDEPCPLELLDKLVYDSAGYFLKQNTEQWQPRYNLYESKDEIRLIVELPGFKQGECPTILRENDITIKGLRADFNTSANDTTVRQADIPSGSFKLQIPFPYEIDTTKENFKTIRDEGFIRITAIKKKLIEDEIVL